MGIRSAWKAARIATAVEKDIKPRMHRIFRFNYDSQYAWGTPVGNHIFDSVAQRSIKERLGEADDFVLSILYMLIQAREDENTGAASGFEKILLDVLPYMVKFLSLEVGGEVAWHVDTTKMSKPI